MKSNAGEETYEVVELFGKSALFTDNLIGTVPLCFIHMYFYFYKLVAFGY